MIPIDLSEYDEIVTEIQLDTEKSGLRRKINSHIEKNKQKLPYLLSMQYSTIADERDNYYTCLIVMANKINTKQKMEKIT